MLDFQSFLRREPYPLYIDGHFVPALSGKTKEAVNPARQEVFARYAQGGVADARLAIQAARKAFDGGAWPTMSQKERSYLLLKAAELLEKRLDEFAVIETLDCGKLYGGVRYYEALMAVDALRFFAGKARCLEGKILPTNLAGTINLTESRPYGVVAEILPWNGPLMMGCQKLGAILAAGNTVVIKPSSEASMSMLLMAEIFHEAGFPAGVVNVVTGSGAELGDLLSQSPDVDMISMTGGTETGKRIMTQGAPRIAHLALELGGKSPNIVFADCLFEEAVKWARFAFTLNSGQVCVSGTRLLIERPIYERFLEKLAEECGKLKAGDGFSDDPQVNYSGLISRGHAAEVWAYIQSGKEEGARLVCGGAPYAEEELARGCFVPPTVFADVRPEMRIFREEIFGPVLAALPFDTEEEALAVANASRFGLAGAVFSRDIKKALRVARSIRSGQVYVNSYFSPAMAEAPGTGWKESGVGAAGIAKYQITQSLFIDTQEGYVPY